MGYLEEVLSVLDSARRTAGRNISDLVSDPKMYAEKIVGNLRNQNAGVAPVAAGGELTNRPLTMEERVDQTLSNLDFGGGMGVVKQKGGNWLPSQIKAQFKPFPLNPEGPHPLTSEWTNSVLMNYIRNKMATPEDPVRLLAEQGITHIPLSDKMALSAATKLRRKEAGFPEKGMAKTPEGKKWETISDSALSSVNAGKLRDQVYAAEAPPKEELDELAKALRYSNHLANYLAADPKNMPNYLKLDPELQFIDRVSPETKINYLVDPQAYPKLAFTGIPEKDRWGPTVPQPNLEWSPSMLAPVSKLRLHELINQVDERVRSGDITPEQIKSGAVSMDNVIRYADALRRKTTDNPPDLLFDMPDKGLSVVRLNRPGQFSQESDALRHSVRGYEPTSGEPYGIGGWSGIQSGEARIHSVRDKSGKPLATIESHHSPDDLFPPYITQIKGKFNRSVDPAALPAIEKFIQEGGFDLSKSEIDQSGLFRVGSGNETRFVSMDGLKAILSRRTPEGEPVMDQLGNDAVAAMQHWIDSQP